MLTLGIDPGIARCGYGLVEKNGNVFKCVDYGCIETSSKTPEPQRLLEIYSQVKQIIQLHKPQKICIEKLFFSNNAKTAFQVGQARGVVVLCAAEHNLPILELTPNEIKLGVTGYGKADKKQMQEMIKMLLKLREIPKPDDAADALGIALTGSTWIEHKTRNTL